MKLAPKRYGRATDTPGAASRGRTARYQPNSTRSIASEMTWQQSQAQAMTARRSHSATRSDELRFVKLCPLSKKNWQSYQRAWLVPVHMRPRTSCREPPCSQLTHSTADASQTAAHTRLQPALEQTRSGLIVGRWIERPRAGRARQRLRSCAHEQRQCSRVQQQVRAEGCVHLLANGSVVRVQRRKRKLHPSCTCGKPITPVKRARNATFHKDVCICTDSDALRAAVGERGFVEVGHTLVRNDNMGDGMTSPMTYSSLSRCS
jgi:hypothetical protein